MDNVTSSTNGVQSSTTKNIFTTAGNTDQTSSPIIITISSEKPTLHPPINETIDTVYNVTNRRHKSYKDTKLIQMNQSLDQMMTK